MVFETPDEMSAGKKLSMRRGIKISFSRKSSSKKSPKLTALTESDNVDVIASPIAENDSGECQEKASNEPEIDTKSGSIPTKSPSVKSPRWRFKSKRSESNGNVKTEPKISDDDKLESRCEPGSNSAEKYNDPTACPEPGLGIGDINEACVGSDQSKCPTTGIGNGDQHKFYVKGVGYVVPVRRGGDHLLTCDNLTEHFHEKANLNGDQDISDAYSNGSSRVVMNSHPRQQLGEDSPNIPNETVPPRIPPKPASLRSRPLPSLGPSKSLSEVNEEVDNSDIPPRPPARPKNRSLGKQRLWQSSGGVTVRDNRATVYEIISLVPKESCLAEELGKLPRQPWYWGPLTQAQAEEKLAKLPDGNFLVRDSSDERYLLSLSFNSHGRTLHTRIEHRNGLFSLNDSDGHTSIVELVECAVKESRNGVYGYMRDALGVQSFPARLTDWVSRFTEMRSLQHLCRFLIREVYPRHHIQRLPLPKKIKEYILENQY